MGRRSFSRNHEIKYPSRVEGWLDVCGKYFHNLKSIVSWVKAFQFIKDNDEICSRI